MAATQIHDELTEICDIYTKLTSFLIELGYQVYVDRMCNMDDIECAETTMRVLEIMNEFYQEAQSSPAKSSNINKTTVIDGGLGRSGYSRRQEGQEKVIATINSERLKELVKETLESSLKEPMPSKIPMRNLVQYKDSMDELLAGLRGAEAPNSPKINNEQIKRLAQKAEAWRQRMYRSSEKAKKWKTAPPKEFDYIYYDDAPSTSANHNTSINVENLNLEI